MNVELTWPEVLQAAHVGVLRQVFALRHDKQDRYGCADSWTSHINGACGELAAAKALGLFWSGAIGDLRARDVGPYQIRATERLDGCLILHPDDDDNHPFVLVVGSGQHYRLAGWILAREGKQDCWWRGPRPAWFVPQSELQPMATLQRAAA